MEATFSKSNAHLLLLWHKSAFVALLSRSKVFFLPNLNVMFSTTNGTSSLLHGQFGLLKILQLLMNMDKRLQPIIGWYVTDLARSSVCTLSQLIKNRAQSKALCVTDCMRQEEKIHGCWILGTTMWSGIYSNARNELIWKTDVSKRSRSQ